VEEEVEHVKEEVWPVEEEVVQVKEEVGQVKEEVEQVKEEVGQVEEEGQEEEEKEEEVEESGKEEVPVQIKEGEGEQIKEVEITEEEVEQVEDEREEVEYSIGDAEQDQGSTKQPQDVLSHLLDIANEDTSVNSTTPVALDDNANISITENLFSDKNTISAQDSFEFKLAYEPQDQILPMAEVAEEGKEQDEPAEEAFEAQASDQAEDSVQFSIENKALDVSVNEEIVPLDVAGGSEAVEAEDTQVVDAAVEELEEVELEVGLVEEDHSEVTSDAPAAEMELEVSEGGEETDQQQRQRSEVDALVKDEQDSALALQAVGSGEDSVAMIERGSDEVVDTLMEEEEAEREMVGGLGAGAEDDKEDEVAAEEMDSSVPEEVKSEEIEEEEVAEDEILDTTTNEESEVQSEVEIAASNQATALELVEEDKVTDPLSVEESQQVPQGDESGAGEVKDAYGILSFDQAVESSAADAPEKEEGTPAGSPAECAEEDLVQISSAVVSNALESAVTASGLTESSTADPLAEAAAISGFGDILGIDFGPPAELATENLPEIPAEEIALVGESQPIDSVRDSSDNADSREMEAVDGEVGCAGVETEVSKNVSDPFSQPDEVEQEIFKCSPAEAGLFSAALISGQMETEEDLTTGDGLESRSSGRSGSDSGGESADTPVLPADACSTSSSPVDGDSQELGAFSSSSSKKEDAPEPVFELEKEGEDQLVSVVSEEGLTVGDGMYPSDLMDDAATPEPEELSEAPEQVPFYADVNSSDQPLLELSDSNELLLTAGIADTALESQQDLLTNPFSTSPKALEMDDPFGFQLAEETGTYPQPKSQVPTDPFFTLEEAATGKSLQDPLPVSTTLATEDDTEENVFAV